MNIYAREGFQVVCVDNPTASGRKTAMKHLKIGQVYTIQSTSVHSWSTEVFLKEFPDISFGVANFADFSPPQSAEDDAKHPDWARYHRLP